MAALTSAERERVHRLLMRRWSGQREACTFTKAELRAAVDAIDTWLEANATTINQQFPAAFRTTATPAQKAAVLSYVAMTRFGDDPREG